jgi:hypothetical protein
MDYKRKHGVTTITNEQKKKQKMQTHKAAGTQKIPALAVDGYTGIFCLRTATTILFINLF